MLKSGAMIVRPYRGHEPRIGNGVFVAENATLIGDVELDDDVSIWYGTVVRGDIYPIRIGARSNIQDNCVLHGGVEPATDIGRGATVGHLCVRRPAPHEQHAGHHQVVRRCSPWGALRIGVAQRGQGRPVAR